MNSSVIELSANARSMQVQFSRSLIAQVCGVIFSEKELVGSFKEKSVIRDFWRKIVIRDF
jgi:hypothetical protein